ncbi:histidine phosphatase family protein [Microbulbifer sp. OS29]|uniref:Histidine phosphatase family protein n=1 Tax=Microbulbifer okhotskensis TaxID=2926617 RepID=A0A9X2EPP4_9GAMM|nr:histidine phosphatase family protein [Microbulbifer okhotskensis]MCO1336157.1 histidine phosphatase family protein [Microbulbifer okhotskensis]
MQIDLLRHGACTGGNIFRGQIDVPLTDEGWEQMSRGLAELSGPWSRIITSPLQRCQLFATELAREKKLAITQAPGIREIGFGDWEGQSVDKIWAEQTLLCEAWGREPDKHTPPGGEPFPVFRSRVLQTIDYLSHRYSGEPLLLVTHGGVIKLLLILANGWLPVQMISLQINYGFAASLRYDRNNKTFAVCYPDQAAYVYRP